MADSNASDDDPATILGRRLEDCYRHIHVTAMADVPICNPVLGVAATGFRVHGPRAFGVVTTPWFMSLVAADLPDASPSAPSRVGVTVRQVLPAGEVEFIVGDLPGFGRIDSCSLFSPMFEFADMTAAMDTARLAMEAFFDPAVLEPEPVAATRTATPISRRDLLRGAFDDREGRVQ